MKKLILEGYRQANVYKWAARGCVILALHLARQRGRIEGMCELASGLRHDFEKRSANV